ncbi:MAG TPA: hypothetical protein VLG50_04915 [Candidatus Saccharimonadales bacterium]|nr:hypothetical protein [Candidatus Saccharimonadales bacterium]
MSYTCTVGKNNVLYVFKIKENGSKVRTKNIYASQCPRKEIKNCKQLCSNKSVHKKLKTPCRKQRTVFTNQKEVKTFCKSKVKGDYPTYKRQEMADKANKLLQEELKEYQDELKQMVTFKTTPYVTTYKSDVPITKTLKKPKSRAFKYAEEQYYSLNALRKMASEQQIAGRSKMNKHELCQALKLQCI